MSQAAERLVERRRAELADTEYAIAMVLAQAADPETHSCTINNRQIREQLFSPQSCRAGQPISRETVRNYLKLLRDKQLVVHQVQRAGKSTTQVTYTFPECLRSASSTPRGQDCRNPRSPKGPTRPDEAAGRRDARKEPTCPRTSQTTLPEVALRRLPVYGNTQGMPHLQRHTSRAEEPTMPPPKRVCYHGTWTTIRALARKHGKTARQVSNRLGAGKSLEDALTVPLHAHGVMGAAIEAYYVRKQAQAERDLAWLGALLVADALVAHGKVQP